MKLISFLSLGFCLCCFELSAKTSSKSQKTVAYPVINVATDFDTEIAEIKEIEKQFDNKIREKHKFTNATLDDIMIHASVNPDHFGYNGSFDPAAIKASVSIKGKTFGDILNKICADNDLMWKASINKKRITFIKLEQIENYTSKTYKVPKSFVRIVTNLPYLRTNKSRFKNISTSNKNIAKGLSHLGINLAYIDSNQYKYFYSPNSREQSVSYNPGTGELTLLTAESKQTRFAHLLQSYLDNKGWQVFYDFKKAEHKLQAIKIDNFNVSANSTKEIIEKLEKLSKEKDTIYGEGLKFELDGGMFYSTAPKIIQLTNLSLKDAIKEICQETNTVYSAGNNKIYMKLSFQRKF